MWEVKWQEGGGKMEKQEDKEEDRGGKEEVMGKGGLIAKGSGLILELLV